MAHKGFFLRCTKMMQGLSDPDNVEWTIPVVDGFDEILTAQIDRTGETCQRLLGDVEGGLRDIDPDIPADAGASERLG